MVEFELVVTFLGSSWHGKISSWWICLFSFMQWRWLNIFKGELLRNAFICFLNQEFNKRMDTTPYSKLLIHTWWFLLRIKNTIFILLGYPPSVCLIMLLLPVSGVAKLVFVLYKHLGQFLSTENATLRGMGDLNKRNLSLTVNSHILSASITKESSRVFVADPVIFTLEHLDVSLLLRLPQTTL